jgi:hypothetical protein
MGAPSTYEIYKEGTHKFVSWLEKTAAPLGYEKSGRSSPRARDDGAQNPAEKCSLPLREFPILAKFVSEHLPSSNRSEMLLNLDLLGEVISRRKIQVAKIQKSKCQNSLVDSQHGHFNIVLENIYQILDTARIVLARIKKEHGWQWTTKVSEHM